MSFITKYDNITIDDLETTGKIYLGDTSPIYPLVDGGMWCKKFAQFGGSLMIQSSPWSGSLLTLPSTGLGTPSLGTCTFDLTGGTFENLFTIVATGGWTFSSADIGKLIVLTDGAHVGGWAMVNEIVSNTEVVLETADWDDDLAAGTGFLMVNDPVSFSSSKLKLNGLGPNSEWEIVAKAHLSEYVSKFCVCAAANSVTNMLIQTDGGGYDHVDSIIIEHLTGDLGAGELAKAIRLTIDDSLCTGGATAEVDGIKLNRIRGGSLATATAINVGTAFTNALKVAASIAEDPFYGYTFTAAFAVTSRIELGETIAAANELLAAYNAHCADATEHTTSADAVNTIAAPAATDLTSLITLVTEMLTDYDAHEADAELGIGWAYHAAQEASDHSLASIVAPATLTECRTRLADIKAKFNAHDADTSAHGTDTLHQVALTLGGDNSFVDPAVNTQMFTADNYGILIGSDNVFSVIEYVQQVAGSATITPTWQYSTGDGTWATLTVSDTTTGMRYSGKISFTPPALWAKSAHCDGATGDITNAYYVRITRTAGALATPPTEQYFKVYTGASATDTLIRGDGTIQPAQLTDASAPSNSIYYSTTASKLVFKDPGGTVRNLY